jgi:glycine/D-amino acid oxidase-like deaminating enzyme
MAETFDVIIVGGGPMGLASAYECCIKEGKKVLLLERFSKFANVHGSSVGYSRQFRVSYSEKNLSDLALQTYDMWTKLMDEMNNHSLLQVTGCLWFGDPSVETGEGNIDLAIKNLIELGQTEPEDYRVLDGKEAIMNDPQFKFVSQAVADIENAKALYTTKGGTVNVPGLVQCYVDALKINSNATLVTDAQVTKIDHSHGDYIEVKALVNGNDQTYRGDKVILTPGTYVNYVLSSLYPPFNYYVNQIVYLWGSTYYPKKADPHPSGNDPAKWPIWYFFGPKPTDDGTGVPLDYNDYYGFPSEPENSQNLRVAPAFTSHEDFDFMLFPPDINQRPLDENALDFTSNFVDKSMPDLRPSRNNEYEATCVAGFAQMKNPDAADKGAGFVIDFLPCDKRIVVFTGGWAMKFVPMIGKILTDLAIRGETQYQELIDPMNINRGILVNAHDCQSNLKPSKLSVAQKSKTFRKIWC